MGEVCITSLHKYSMNGSEHEQLLRTALAAAHDTCSLSVEFGARRQTAAVFESLFGSAAAVLVADENTFVAAGRDVQDSFSRAGHTCAQPLIFGPKIHAEYSLVEFLKARLGEHGAIPVAVGSGTINDLTKLAAHRANRPYVAVATAASMDGYTAFGASITYRGSKQTFECPAPSAVLADLDVIADAPEGMNASGYADLLAKCAAGADWILADAAGVERIDEFSWNTVQGLLRSWISLPAGIAQNDPACLRHLINGLMMSGFAMQALRSSRPASGAEHQFSHLWDMQNHTHNGALPSHGFKVGIGTLASLALYELLLVQDSITLSIDRAVEVWPSFNELEHRITACLGDGELSATGRQEMRAKYATREELREQLTRLRNAWPGLQTRLRPHLLSLSEARDMLREAGCPFEPEQIGIPRERLRLSYEQAYFIRRRFTVLDFAERWGLTGRVLEKLFGAGGPWPLARPSESGDGAPMMTGGNAGAKP